MRPGRRTRARARRSARAVRRWAPHLTAARRCIAASDRCASRDTRRGGTAPGTAATDAPIRASSARVTFDEHVAVAMPREAGGHPANRVRLGALDVDLDEIDAARMALVEQRIERHGLATRSPPTSAPCAARDTPQLPPRSSKPTNAVDSDAAPAATRCTSTCGSPLLARRSPRASTASRGCGSSAITRPRPADEMRADEREIAPVGADVDDDHARTEQPAGRAAFPAARTGR